MALDVANRTPRLATAIVSRCGHQPPIMGARRVVGHYSRSIFGARLSSHRVPGGAECRRRCRRSEPIFQARVRATNSRRGGGQDPSAAADSLSVRL